MNGWKTYKSSNALICWSECLSWHKSFSWQRKRYYCCTCSSSCNCLSTWWRYVLWFAQMECYDMSLDSTLKAPLLPCPFLFFSSFRWNPCTCTVRAHVADDDWVFMLGGPHFWIQCLIVLIQSEHHNHWLYPPVHDLLVAGGYRVLVYNIWLFSCNQSIITIGCILSMMTNQGRPTLKIKKLKKRATLRQIEQDGFSVDGDLKPFEFNLKGELYYIEPQNWILNVLVELKCKNIKCDL